MTYADFSPERKRRAVAATRRWQRANPNKVRASHRRANAAWRQRNPDKVKQMARAAYAKDKQKHREKNRKMYQAHAAKRIAAACAWAKANPERARKNANRSRWRRAGVDPSAAEARLATHGGRCDCCGSARPGGRWSWNVDHDHATGSVRGILCHNCNTAIGKLGDTLEGVLRAVKYLSTGPMKGQANV